MLRNIVMHMNKPNAQYCKIFVNQQMYVHKSPAYLSDEKQQSGVKVSARISEFRKKLRETTPISDLGQQTDFQPEKDDPLPPWPDNTNPNTGEVGGPRGPEPTRYGDWERKGRVTDF